MICDVRLLLVGELAGDADDPVESATRGDVGAATGSRFASLAREATEDDVWSVELPPVVRRTFGPSLPFLSLTGVFEPPNAIFSRLYEYVR